MLPLLEREFNPNIKQALAQTATLTAEDADCLNELAEEKFLQYVLQDDHSCSCDTAWLLSLPAALCSRIIRMMWKKLGAAGLLTFQQTQQVIGLVHKGSSNKKAYAAWRDLCCIQLW